MLASSEISVRMPENCHLGNLIITTIQGKYSAPVQAGQLTDYRLNFGGTDYKLTGYTLHGSVVIPQNSA